MEHDSSVRFREQRNVWKGSPGRFPFHQNVRFELSATSSSEWNSILQNFPKKDNLARYTQIWEIFVLKVLFPFNFAPGISENFSGKFLYHLPLFPSIRKI